MQLSVLLQSLDVLSIHGWTDSVDGIHYDSRKITPGMLFVARQAVAIDGHDYIDMAIHAGATAVVCERLPATIAEHPDCCFVQVASAQKALALLAAAWYHHPSSKLRLIGITGTNGKTSCTFILKQLLEACGSKVAVIGTTGHFIGSKKIPSANTTPEAPELHALLARMYDEGADTVVMEVSSHALATERVYGLHWKAAIFTNLSQDHLDFHHSMDDYARAKKKLFESLRPTDIAILNSEDPATALMIDHCVAQVHLVGRSSALPNSSTAPWHRISNEVQDDGMTSFRLDAHTWHSPFVGTFNVDNVALCLCCCMQLGQDPENLLASVPRLRAAPGRLECISLDRNRTAVVDYAHSPDALEKTLRALKSSTKKQHMVCVFGAGGDRDKAKRPLMGAIAEREADLVIVTNDNPRTESPIGIVIDILSGMEHPEMAAVILDRAEAIRAALSAAPDGAIVLVAGKGHEDYQILGTERLPFSDRDIILSECGRSPHE